TMIETWWTASGRMRRSSLPTCPHHNRAVRALLLREFKGPDGVLLEDVPSPTADGRRTALIEVHAAGVSFADMLITRGEYQVRPPLPFVPGLEVAGVVRQAPPGTGFAAGDRVAAFMFGGAFAEEATADPATMVPIPDDVGFTAAAGLIVN